MSPATAQRGRTDRRTFLKTAGGVVLSAAAGAAWGQRAGATTPKRVYVLVLDGLRPDEVHPSLMPNVSALRDGGLRFPNARSLPVMETIPNHVMMMTGVRPDRSGVPGNSIYDRAERVIRDMDRPTDIRFPTVIQRLNAAGRTTGTVLSKEYLFGVFGTRATYRWEPAPIVPVSGHAPDAFTDDALIAMVNEADPDFVFANFGDIDRFGHADLTGPLTLDLARKAALADTDVQIGRFVSTLKATGKWSSSVLIVLADHSMDWSLPHRMISLAPALNDDALLSGRVQIAQNGGADLLYWTGPATSLSTAVNRMRSIVSRVPGVLSTHLPGDLRLGTRAGDVVAFCKAGWRFSDPQPISNPIPGNHGHPATEPIPFFITGGVTWLPRGTRLAAARTVDVAATVGKLFGLGAPSGGYDGTARV